MTTRSTIGYIENGILFQIYCHWFGYISNNGKLLVNHYNTLGKIKELFSFGNVSSLEESIQKTTFYYRNRKEELELPTESPFTRKNLTGFVPKWQEEYNYIFFNNFWYVLYYENSWKRLTPNIIKAYK